MSKTLAKRKQSANHEVDVDEVRQIYTDLGLKQPTAVDYKPEFRDDVTVIGPDGAPVDVNPNYCSTVPSAMGLMCILGDLDPVGYRDEPQDFATGSQFYFSDQVPWLRFNNGAVRNAAQLSQFWKANSGDPGGKTAEANARQDIAWG